MELQDGRTPEDQARWDLGWRFARAIGEARFRDRLKAAGWKSGMPIVPVVDPLDDDEFWRVLEPHIAGRYTPVTGYVKIWSESPTSDDFIRFSVYTTGWCPL